MGDDEVMALVFSLVLGLMGTSFWYGRGLGVSWFHAPRAPRALLLVVPPIALAGLWRALVTEAAIDVRTDVRYQFLFVAMGSIWVLLLPRVLSLIGVSYRDDALERRNVSAAIAIAGTTLGLGMVFTGSNMGEGPSIWNTVETAMVATTMLFGAVFVLALATAVGDTIAIERDVAAGVRFAGWIAASSMVLAAAAAGDWAGEDAMVADLVSGGWPAAVLLVVAIGLELAFRPRVSAPRPSVIATGIVPATLYVAVSLAYVARFSG